MSAEFYKRTTCRMCEGSKLEQVLTLTPTPPGNRLLKADELNRDETRYPLDVYFCNDCTHIQLGHVVDPRILYQKDYLYVSGTSVEFVRHLEQYAADMVDRFHLSPGDLVADIGSNDGTCLRFFQQRGMNVLGVDPATAIARSASESGIPTVGAFFSLALAENLRKRHGPAAFITSHNACAHIDQLDDVIRGVSHWLSDDGLFVLEVGYFVDVFCKLFFDTIYHEHLDYHTVRPWQALFARTGMELISVERTKPQGGSIRVFAQKAGGPLKRDSSIDELILLESRLGLNQPDTISRFGDRILGLREKLRAILREAKAAGKSIAGYGAPTKAVTLLSHFGIGAEYLDFVVEDNPLKHGQYLPVSHIPVCAPAELYRRRPDFILILAWNFAGSIMAAHSRLLDEGSRFIVPMPDPQIV